MFTRDDLKSLQNYPLSVKVGRTQAKVMEYYEALGGKVYVSMSGGKDSTVLLDIVRRVYPDVVAVFVDTGLEYPGIRRFVKTFDNVIWLRPEKRFHEVVKEYGYPVLGKEMARCIYYARKGSDWALKKIQGKFKDGKEAQLYQHYVKYQYLLDAPFDISDECCHWIKKKPLIQFERQTGLHPITGQMASESFRRQSNWLKYGCNVFSNHRIISNPMSFWTDQDVLEYLLMTGIPYAQEDYGLIVPADDISLQLSFVDKPLPKLTTTGCKRTGCFPCMFGVHREKTPNRFQKLYHTYPKLYDYTINTLGCGAVMDYIGVDYRPIPGGL